MNPINIYILILLTKGMVATQEFYTLGACNAARQTLVDDAVGSRRVKAAYCVPKYISQPPRQGDAP